MFGFINHVFKALNLQMSCFSTSCSMLKKTGPQLLDMLMVMVGFG